jgi:uncharacterized protein YndB with AHSA1/START domain
VPVSTAVTTDPEVIRVERRIAAPPEAIYRYLTESALWSRWQGESAELDPVAGGRVVIRMSEDQVVEGSYVEIRPTTRVVITWGWRGHPRMPPGTTTVEFDLVADGDGTIVRLTHREIPADDLPIHRQGWDVFLPRLATVAAGGDPGPNPV